MSIDQDQAKLIAERVARRLKGTDTPLSPPVNSTEDQNGWPAREELSAIREGLHDLESKLDRIETKIVQGGAQSTGPTRARVIDFVSSGPPVVTAPKILNSQPEVSHSQQAAHFVATTSPWLAGMSGSYDQTHDRSLEANPQSAISNPQSPSHPSQERFGVEEAAVSELVEFFESEKKCSLDPSGRPCDHCEMCSSRGF